MADRYSVVFTQHQLKALENVVVETLEDLKINSYASTSKSRGLTIRLSNCLEAIQKKKTVRSANDAN